MSKPNVLEVIKSVLAAAVGIQSNENRQKDFSQPGSLPVYIVAGVVFTVLFVVGLIFVVSAIMSPPN